MGSLRIRIGRFVRRNLSKQCSGEYSCRNERNRVLGAETVALLSLGLLLCGVPVQAMAQPAKSPGAPDSQRGLPEPPGARASSGEQQADLRSPGSITGTVVDPSGAAVTGARVSLTRPDTPPNPQSPDQEALSGDGGEFSFGNIAPGPFRLTITAAGFANQVANGVVHPGEALIVPEIALAVATEITQVQVVVPRVEVAEAEIKDQEKQRVFGVIPNFYVSYIPDAAPLTPKQKFELAWKTTVDPVTFILTGAVAGVQQAQDDFKGYGQGAQGYGKRYGASYADTVTSTFIGSAILPSLLKQDPRYFYKGTGSTRSRILYAIANSVICKGDNKRWQANYSNILGSLAAGGISNLYYPAADRNGAALTFENALIGIGSTAAANILQEFVIRKLTPNPSNSRSTAKP